MSRLARRVASAAVVTLFAFVCAASGQNEFQPLTITDAHRYVAGQAQNAHYHILPVTTPEARAAASRLNASQRGSARPVTADVQYSRPVAAVAGDPAPFRFGGDVQYYGGATLTSTVFHSAFVNTTVACPPNACWGDPLGFSHDLFQSDFIHVMDQYTGAYGRYAVGTNFAVNYPVMPGVPLTEQDMQAIAYEVASKVGAGYGNMVHIFLPPGQDDCVVPGVCFSPDNPSTFYFCANHGSFTSNIGDIVYSVEPFTDVPGCQMESGTPNGQLADTINFGVGHETIEAISDPDPESGWANFISTSLYGSEIADECVLFAPGQGQGDDS
ncbi:MAG: hypothetical protein ABSD75_16530 [Terriglobales bacterium]|jgi:hypothetical protein